MKPLKRHLPVPELTGYGFELSESQTELQWLWFQGAYLFMIFPVFPELPILCLVIGHDGGGGVGAPPSASAWWQHEVK